MKIRRKIEDRSTPVTESGCWLWEGALLKTGYGCLRIDGKTKRVHRVAYEAYREAIPDGKVIDHLCRVRSCVNPWHMEVVTQQENVKRGLAPELARRLNGEKTSCPKGHLYSGDNLYLTPQGSRHCRKCRYETMMKWQRENRNAHTKKK